MPTAKSYLFVPGDRPERFEKALNSHAGMVILDLEDAVAPQAKDSAREGIRQWLETSDASQFTARLMLRVNDVDTSWYGRDVALLGSGKFRGVMLPKAQSVKALEQLSATLEGQQEIIPLIETVQGWDNARQLGGVNRVSRLAFGSVDFAIDAGIEGDQEELDYVRASLVLQSRLAGLAKPVDGVTVDFRNLDVLTADVERSRRFGFGAKLCIHPAQVDIVNEGYAPSEKEIDWANRVLEGVEKFGLGAFALEGKLLDKPLFIRAQRILAAT
ncbi:MAG: CoA ester lyase [Alcaligenaceae bacterium]|nr:CoA ester lyase [Alcaligenaceae bacterium]